MINKIIVTLLMAISTITCMAQHKKTSQIRDSVMLKNVVVTGKTKAQQIREGAYTVNALQMKEITASVTSLSDIISRSSGINIRTEGGLGSDFSLSINGMSGNSIRYFVDGVPITSMGNNVNLSNFPVSTIDRIEVYKGVVPAWLGGDALGGAVNIITKQMKKNFLDASVTYGSYNTYRADINAQVTLGKAGIILRPRFSYDYSKNNYKVYDVELWDEDVQDYVLTSRERFHDRYQSVMGQMEVGVENKSWADQFFVGASYTNTLKQLQTGSVQTKVIGQAEKNGYAWNIHARYKKRGFLLPNLTSLITLSHTWDKSVTIDTAYVRYDWNGDYKKITHNETNGRARLYRWYSRPQTLVRANFSYEMGEHHSIGLNYMLNRTGNRRYDTASDYYTDETDYDYTFVPSNDALTKHIIGFSYDQNLFNGRWVNSFFVKDYINSVYVEQTDLSWITYSDEVDQKTIKNNIGYGVGTRFTIVDAFSIKLGYEKAARLPLANELLGNGTTIYANLKLQPELSNNVNVGFFGTIPIASGSSGGGHTIYYELGGFLRYTTDYIHLRVNDADGTAQYQNVNDVDTKGFEGEIRYNWGDWLQLTVNGSYQESLDMQEFLDNGNTSVTYKNRIPNRPWLFGNGELTLTKNHLFTKTDRLRFNYLCQYKHWYYLTWEGYGSIESKAKIPTQWQQNAALTYSWLNDRYGITLTCENIFDKVCFDNYKLQKPGRTLMCKFRVYLR